MYRYHFLVLGVLACLLPSVLLMVGLIFKLGLSGGLRGVGVVLPKILRALAVVVATRHVYLFALAPGQIC